MAKWTFLFWILFLPLLPAGAQVSHGGRPLPLSLLRSPDGLPFEVMPSFDVAQQLRLDSLNESDLRSGYRFAYKFMTDYNRGNAGRSFTLPDGTKVWRLGIRSEGALSLNVLFTEYELPEGAQLFLYNADQTQILGAFNHLNNSELHLLPVAPIQGDELIIEYQEPARAEFPGRLTVGEVNHGYRSLRGEKRQGNESQQGELRGDEPREDRSEFDCMPVLACYPEETDTYEVWGRSVVMMLIDGHIACTGVLVNNTAADGKPYLLTASHCLNQQFQIKNPDYAQVAGSIVCFFNYDSPLCRPVMRGTEEMSVASARYIAVDEQSDMALLELLETPPAYYRPYYAGWNAGSFGPAPYAGIHHPGGAVKRINLADHDLSLTTFRPVNADFYANAHIHVAQWNAGCTAAGSSGSPLFNAAGEVIGALSGGSSTCGNPQHDYYYHLDAAWNPSDEAEKQLACWLNPADNETRACEGLDPYASSPCFRLSHIRSSGKTEQIESTRLAEADTEPLFGNNSTGVTEYAVAYSTPGPAVLYGAYFVTPSAGNDYRDMKVTVKVYTGAEKPATLLHTETFQPAYCNKVTFNNTFQETDKPLNRAQESFLRFSSPLAVEGNFYIAYEIVTAPPGTYFSVYNLPEGEITRNTAWIKASDGWTEAPAYSAAAFPTTLFIDPVVQYVASVGTIPIQPEKPVRIYRGAEKGLLYIQLPEAVSSARYAVFSTDGKTQEEGLLRDRSTALRLRRPASGITFIRITYGEQQHTEKIIF